MLTMLECPVETDVDDLDVTIPVMSPGQYAAGPLRGVVSPERVQCRDFAVWTLREDNQGLPAEWVPENELSTPPPILDGFPKEMVSPFVAAFNATDLARRHSLWAVLLQHGGFLVLQIDATQRPGDPAALPLGALSGLTCKEAEDTVRLANELILRTARVPRMWHVVLAAPTFSGN